MASFKHALVVPRLPKTRSGKILRATMRKIADGGMGIVYEALQRGSGDPLGGRRNAPGGGVPGGHGGHRGEGEQAAAAVGAEGGLAVVNAAEAEQELAGLSVPNLVAAGQAFAVGRKCHQSQLIISSLRLLCDHDKETLWGKLFRR